MRHGANVTVVARVDYYACSADCYPLKNQAVFLCFKLGDEGFPRTPLSRTLIFLRGPTCRCTYHGLWQPN